MSATSALYSNRRGAALRAARAVTRVSSVKARANTATDSASAQIAVTVQASVRPGAPAWTTARSRCALHSTIAVPAHVRDSRPGPVVSRASSSMSSRSACDARWSMTASQINGTSDAMAVGSARASFHSVGRNGDAKSAIETAPAQAT